MTVPKQSMIRVLRRRSEQISESQPADAVIWVTPSGAEVELADGSSCTFLQLERGEPVIEAGIRWAREQGAVVINIRR